MHANARHVEVKSAMPPATGVARECILRRPSGRSTRPARVAKRRTPGTSTRQATKLIVNIAASVIMVYILSTLTATAKLEDLLRSRNVYLTSGIGEYGLLELRHEDLDQLIG